MKDLAVMRIEAEAARLHFERLVAKHFPGLDKWHWYRAMAAEAGHVGRPNADTSKDKALAGDLEIETAHNEYIRLLHVFYKARDGEHGFLGGRGV